MPTAALVTTAGFRDVLEIMRTNNPYMYDLKWVKPKPLIPRNLRFEVSERVRHTGEVWQPLDEDGTREIARHIKGLGIETVAVCFLNAYVNKTQPNYNEIGVAYMLVGDSPVSNKDPYATEPTTPDDWVTDLGAHLMMLIPDRSYLEGVSTDHLNGGPWVMWPETQYAHLMIPVVSR